MSNPKIWIYTFIAGSIIIGCAILADMAAVAIGRPPDITFYHIIVIGTVLVLLASAIMKLIAAILSW